MELWDRKKMRIAKDLVAASDTPLVLGILAESESYGYAILKRVAELSGGQLQWTDGMLYPLLHRLERLGHVEASWGASETGRRRKYTGEPLRRHSHSPANAYGPATARGGRSAESLAACTSALILLTLGKVSP